jgi:hypothetical protein
MDSPFEGVVLLDVTPGEAEAFDVSFLERTGHPVLVCHGPQVDELCPLLGGHGCSKFETAHWIVFALDLDRPQHREILGRYRAMARPDLPIRAVVRPDQAERYHDLLTDIEVCTHEPTVVDLDGFAAEVEATDRLQD